MDDEITAEELQSLLDEDADVRIIDIRSPAAFRRGHIPGSENVPFGELTARLDEFADADRIVTVCPRGEASVQAARLVGSYERTTGSVASLSCGVEGWPGETTPETDVDADADAVEDAPF